MHFHVFICFCFSSYLYADVRINAASRYVDRVTSGLGLGAVQRSLSFFILFLFTHCLSFSHVCVLLLHEQFRTSSYLTGNERHPGRT